MNTLHLYQKKAVAEIQNRLNPLLVAPTGSGKTMILAEIIRRAPNEMVLFLAHRRELIFQARDELKGLGISAGIIMAGVKPDPMCRVQIVSVQTVFARCIRRDEDLPPARTVIVDEAHHIRARTYQAILARFPEAKIIGATATPVRADGRGLGGAFDSIVETPQIPELIRQGFLVGTKVYAPADSQPNLVGVSTASTGDYVLSQLEARMDTERLVGDVVTHWFRHAERRPTVVFAAGVDHSIHLRDEFIKAGVRAEHIDGNTPKDQRDEILQRLYRGDLELICNFGVLTEGWNAPAVSCLVLARPTKSMGLYRQMVGRVLRTSPGKDHALILDHAAATIRHGFVEDEVAWSLDSDRKAVNLTAAALGGKPSDRLVECIKCQALRTAGKACDHCGYLPKRPGAYHSFVDGDLAELSRNGRADRPVYTLEEKLRWLGMLAYMGAERGYKSGWYKHKYREKFGSWPVHAPVRQEPSAEVRSWVRSRQIAWAKQQEQAHAQV
jgi:DNA repair protein RadD